MARSRLPRFALEYLEGGAEEEGALAGNRAAFHRWRFLPRALVDVSKRDLGSTLFGKPLPLPVIIAPTGLNGVFRHKADSQIAAAAGEAGIPFTQSAMSNETVDQVARFASPRHWFQIYIMERDEITDDLIQMAETAGCEALVVTTDAQIFGNRTRSMRGFTDKAMPRIGMILDAAIHMQWLATTLLPGGMPRFSNFSRWIPREQGGLFRSAFWIRDHMAVGLDWERVSKIRERWKRPLLIKGLLAPQDIERATRLGADAVVLSNHGGRQLDWAAAPLDMLPEARAAAGGRIAILMDGGIRSGADIVKAIALGADAVMIGRAALYGLAATGREGVARALAILRDELDRDLGLLGCPRLGDLEPKFLIRAPS